MTDAGSNSDFIDVANFFGNTNYTYQGFVRFAIPSKKDIFSYHSTSYYYIEPGSDEEAATGFTYAVTRE